MYISNIPILLMFKWSMWESTTTSLERIVKTMKFFKNIYFVCSFIILIIGFCLVFNYIQSQNTIIITKDNYIQILKDCHDNIDNYLGKKIVVSGYVYIREDFAFNRLVIAQNISLNPSTPDETYIVGFLCENLSDYNFSNNETIKINGIITKGIYNDLEYPIIEFKNFDFVPYSMS